MVSETQNKIEILDIYSNKFLLNKNYIIKNGDFMKSKNKISYFYNLATSPPSMTKVDPVTKDDKSETR